MKKITMEDIASELGISRLTVWKVINNKSGVSKDLKERVLDKAKEMGYHSLEMTTLKHLMKDDNGEENKRRINIAVIVSRAESSVFWMNIIHEIAKELDKKGINLMYTYIPSKVNPRYSFSSDFYNGKISGAIVLNVYDEGMLSMVNKLNVPKIYLDSIPGMEEDFLTGDILYIEGEKSEYKVVSHLIANGAKRIGFVGDINYARTNLMRFNGFKKAMEEAGLEIEQKLCITESLDNTDFYKEISSVLDNIGEMPDAIACVSDYVAYFVTQYVQEKGMQIPEDIYISGFDGQSNYNFGGDCLTTAAVDPRALGKTLVNTLLYRIDNSDLPKMVTYLNNTIMYAKLKN